VLVSYLSPRVLAAALFGGYSLNMFDPIEGPYPSPNTRLGLATVVTWHNADHYRQIPLSALERYCPAPQPRESTRAPRQLLGFCGISFICT